MAQIALNMSVSDPNRFAGVLREAKDLGLVVHAAYEDLGILSGSIEREALPHLGRIPGLTVEENRTVGVVPMPGRRDRP